MRDDEILDTAIDHVAASLTDGAPSRGFSARVRERIGRPRRSRAWAWQLAGGLALIALVAYFGWPEQENTTTPTVTTRTTTPPSAPQSPAIVAPRGETRVALAERQAIVRRARAPRVLPRIPIDPNAPQIAALNEVTELTVSVARPRDLDLLDLSVREVVIRPLEPGDKEQP